jgi:hypothetical protein
MCVLLFGYLLFTFVVYGPYFIPCLVSCVMSVIATLCSCHVYVQLLNRLDLLSIPRLYRLLTFLHELYVGCHPSMLNVCPLRTSTTNMKNIKFSCLRFIFFLTYL